MTSWYNSDLSKSWQKPIKKLIETGWKHAATQEVQVKDNKSRSLSSNRRKFRSQTSDNMQRWKSRGGKSQRGEVKKWEDQRRERVRSKRRRVREKVGKSRFTLFYQWFGAPEGRKVTSLKRRVRRQLARWEMKNCTPLWRETNFQAKKQKSPHVRTTFGNWAVEKSARRSGAKHISKSKCTKHTRSGPLLEVEMSKKCTPLWREAHFQVKLYKTRQVRTTFGSWDVEKSASRCGAKYISKSKVSKHQVFGPLLEVEMSNKCTPLWREAHF